MNASASSRPLIASCAAALLAFMAGCTICPDPFDYSGPVPNGSPPQNDFRARSGGIIPSGGVSRPWPPVVQAGPDHDAPPHLAVPTAAEEPVADSVAADVDPESAAPVAGDGEASDIAIEAVAEPADTGDVAPPAILDAVGEPEAEMLLPAIPPRPEVMTPLRETPGWRSKG